MRIFQTLISLFVISSLSACGTAFVASKQDDILTQIDVWSAENEYGKAFSTLNYVKKTHPQHSLLQQRKSSLIIQAGEYEQQIDIQVKAYIRNKQWAKALDLIDEAKQKYPYKDKNDNRLLGYTEKYFIQQQEQALALIEKRILLEKAQWMVEAIPLYKEKQKTDPRNQVFQDELAELIKESEQLAQGLTLLTLQAIERKYYKTAKLRINQAINLAPNKKRQKIQAQLKSRSQATYKKQQKTHKRKRKIKQTSILDDIENSYLIIKKSHRLPGLIHG